MGNLDSMLDELNNMENSITLRDENGEEVKLYVLEETKLNGESYLLASDTMTENWSICPRCLRS